MGKTCLKVLKDNCSRLRKSLSLEAFSGDVKTMGLDICWSIDRVDTCVAESYME
jgi:hypothetical protein